MVADGEGARHVYRVVVPGAATAGRGQKGRPDRGPLAPGQDRHGRGRRQLGPDHGRAGRAGARFDPERVEIAFGDHPVVQNGRGLGPLAEAAAQQVIKSGPFTLTIHLNHGDYADYYDTCDYTEDYIRINADYRS